eukprot:g8097.t1
MVRNVSSDLLWTLVRDNSSFLKKQKNLPVMTSEPYNLTGLNSFKYSGLANKKTAGLSVKKSTIKDSKKMIVTLSQKVGPKKAILSTGISKCGKKGTKAIEKMLTKGGYRRDLVAVAAKKYSAILKGFKAAKTQKMNPRAVERIAAKAAAAENAQEED